MKEFKLLRQQQLPFCWSHYEDHMDRDSKGMFGVTWKAFLVFCETRLKEGTITFVRCVEFEDGLYENSKYGLDFLEGEPKKFLEIINDEDIISVFFV